ncbi:MAG: SDR family oxidoreductase [Pseudomonadota bacterium]
MPTALVTGANRGIGAAIAETLAAGGYKLLLVARDEAQLNVVRERCEALGANAEVAAGDLTEADFVAELEQQVARRHGSIDALVNNAGIALGGPVAQADVEAWRRLMDINFHAAVALTRALLPAMLERGTGAVINVSSISGRHTDAGNTIYAASKHALNAFGGCLFEEVRDAGIKVSTIMPGFVATELTEGLGMDGEHMIAASDVAEAVAYVLAASPRSCPTEIVLRPQRRP